MSRLGYAGCQKWLCLTVSERIPDEVDLLPQSPTSLSSALSWRISCLYLSSGNYHHSIIYNFCKGQITFHFIQFAFISNVYIGYQNISKEIFAFYWLPFTSLLLPGASIQSDPSGPRDTSRRAINKTDNSTFFIFTTRSFVSEAVLGWRKWRTNWIVAAGTSYMDLLLGQ